MNDGWGSAALLMALGSVVVIGLIVFLLNIGVM